MKWIDDPSTDPYWNMAVDEWCLEGLEEEERVFRLWRNEPSVIIGITQDPSAEVNLKYIREHGIKLVRRSTGGGAVYHDLQNLNYSFAGPVDKMDSSIVEGMAVALRDLGVAAEVSGRNDIYVDGLKISGYAKRVWHNRALIHGTLMYDVDIDTLTRALDTPESKLHRKGVASVRSRVGNLKDLLPFGSLQGLQDALQERFSAGDSPIAEDRARIAAIRDSKYGTPEWINGKF